MLKTTPVPLLISAARRNRQLLMPRLFKNAVERHATILTYSVERTNCIHYFERPQRWYQNQYSWRHIYNPLTNFVITLVGVRRVASQFYQVQRFDRKLRKRFVKLPKNRITMCLVLMWIRMVFEHWLVCVRSIRPNRFRKRSKEMSLQHFAQMGFETFGLEVGLFEATETCPTKSSETMSRTSSIIIEPSH